MNSNNIRLKISQILTRELENMRDIEDIIYDLSAYYKSNMTLDLNILKKMISISIELITCIINRMGG